ncbi:MAG: Clp protease [Frankiales bacterium]|nr:Clp protease [Frankiales bacterium]
MFERFTGAGRSVVVEAEARARELGSPAITPVHLLLGLLAPAAGPSREVLEAHGVRARDVLAACRPDPASAGFSDEDAGALAALGIDLAAVLRRAEDAFGPDALAPAPRGRHGRTRFSAPSRAVMAASVREAQRLRSGEITSAHLLLGLLRAGDADTLALLRSLGAETAALESDALRTIGRAA